MLLCGPGVSCVYLYEPLPTWDVGVLTWLEGRSRKCTVLSAMWPLARGLGWGGRGECRYQHIQKSVEEKINGI